ncbi:hypothetical protein [Paractinoplanes maris]|uniref:hypothetical protein n=1 Tax=Paractinoplanes maris TaxID=1734446 RepID=UPI002020911D|nr:hypothetical protein [Actinoplanes maris]
MRLPTFSRQSTSDTAETPERPAPASSVARPREDNTTEVRPGPVRARRDEADTLTDLPPAPKHAGRTDPPPPPPAARPLTTDRPTGSATDRPTGSATDRPTGSAADRPTGSAADRSTGSATVDRPADRDAVTPAGRKPRASLLATLGLILGVASVLLVLSGPLMGYGLGVAGVALILSLSGIHATGKRHVAGKTDALLGMILSLGAIVLGVLALTGSLNWLGTDVPAVNNLREWLDTRFIDRF